MPRPDVPPLTRSAVLRGMGFALAVALGAVAVWLIVTGGNQRRIELGVLAGMWGVLLAAYTMFRRPTSADQERDVSAVPVMTSSNIALREGGEVERVAEAAARRAFEQRLEAMLRTEIKAAMAGEVEDLRGEITALRKELLDKVGGQLRLERIETTRVIGSDLEALQHEVRQLKVASGTAQFGAVPSGPATVVQQTTEQAVLRPAPVETVIAPTSPIPPQQTPPQPAVTRPVERPDAAQRERQAREQAAREQAAREQAARDAAQREQASREQASREQAQREQAQREQAAREQAQRERSAREQAARDAALAAQRRADQQRAAEQQAAERRAVAARQETARQEAARREAARLDAAKQEAARQEAAKQEAARQEAARKQAAKQEAAKREAARLDAARRETAKQETATPAASLGLAGGLAGDPFAALPRITPFTDFELDPVDPTPAPARNGAPAPATYTGRRRAGGGGPQGRHSRPGAESPGDGADAEPTDAVRTDAAGPDGADPAAGDAAREETAAPRRRHAGDDGEGSGLLASLLARESSRH